ncbi:hypothetical protein BGX24_006469, partial [Mortierella sp. AD032]
MAASKLQNLIMNPFHLDWNTDRRVIQISPGAIETIQKLRSSSAIRSDLIIMRVDACTDAMLEWMQLIHSGADVEEASEERMLTAMRIITRQVCNIHQS